jgi:hypothetical protein
MAKTIIVARHEPGPATNGHDNCHARTGNNGICPGVGYAEWLNGLGDDDDDYMELMGHRVTCGMVRDNWLRDNHHIVAKDPLLAKLRATERRLSAELRNIRGDIQRAEAVNG